MRPIRLKKCSNCGECVEVCPIDVFKFKGKKVVTARPKDCIECGVCRENCPQDAIRFKK